MNNEAINYSIIDMGTWAWGLTNEVLAIWFLRNTPDLDSELIVKAYRWEVDMWDNMVEDMTIVSLELRDELICVDAESTTRGVIRHYFKNGKHEVVSGDMRVSFPNSNL